jgi:hypothetical protein
MTPEEIKAKSAELAALYTAKANGKILQFNQLDAGWGDVHGMTSPDMRSILSNWRVKPEPRRMWTTANTTVYDEAAALELQRHGMKVTEWQEVLP